MSITVDSATRTSLPRVTAPVWIHPACARYPDMWQSLRITVPSPIVRRPVQTGTHRDMMTTPGPAAGQEDGAPADACPQRPQVQRKDRRTAHQADQEIGADEGRDQPEPDVTQAPDADLPRLPAPDEQPLRGDRQDGDDDEDAAADDYGAQVRIAEAVPGRDPLVALRGHERAE